MIQTLKYEDRRLLRLRSSFGPPELFEIWNNSKHNRNILFDYPCGMGYGEG